VELRIMAMACLRSIRRPSFARSSSARSASALSAFYRCSSASNASMATLVSVSCATSFVSVSGFTC
jgi:hypothetical protein